MERQNIKKQYNLLKGRSGKMTMVSVLHCLILLYMASCITWIVVHLSGKKEKRMYTKHPYTKNNVRTVKRNRKSHKEAHRDIIFERVTNFLCNARLDDIYFENEEYVRADAKVDEIMAKIAKGEITKADEVMMNEYIDSYVYLMTLQTQLAYKQGMKDLAAFTATLFDVNIEDQ